MKYLNTLTAVQEHLDRLGDLPVFSATVNRISQISTSRKSDAMALAMAVMKDASLSARLLRVANSSYYNRGNGRVNVVSRAVVMLGFDQIKSLSVTLKLIEGFKQDGEEDDAISALLMRSFMTAAIAREVAELCQTADIEETYICGLLHGLGEILVAYTLPETYTRMHQQLQNDDATWSQVQLKHLGAHFSDIGQDIAQSWGFPASVVQSMDLMTAEDHPGSIQGNYQMASMADQVLKSIYGHPHETDLDFDAQLQQMAELTGQPSAQLVQCLNNAFKLACDMAQEYNLPSQALVPELRDSGDESLDEFTRKISYYMYTREQNQEQTDNSADVPAAAPQQPRVQPDADLLLEQLQIIGDMVTDHQPIHQVLAQVLSAIVDCTGFQRAAFCLLSKDHKSLDVRISKGQQ
ncbi:MAG: HDOD domain-containing protein, partial [Motiliproteus sp.]|nr:HDOD domain-containing protein [Motiliproteus sp.]